MRIGLASVLLVLLFSIKVFGQEKAEAREDRTIRGGQIVENARKEIGGGGKIISNLVSFQISTRSQSEIGEFVTVNEKQVSFAPPDKIVSVYSTIKPLESKTTSVWNGEKYKKLFELVDFEGRRTVRDATKQETSANSANFVKDKETLEKIKKASAVDPKARLNDDLWSEIFPLILAHPFEPKAEFKYVGKAQSSSGEANVVETTTAGGRSIRLFFDSKTSHLLMMIENYKFFDGDYETKYYYSNRELAGNVLIPKKIKVEHRFTPTGRETRVTHTYIDVVQLLINPKLKPNLFDVN